MNGSPVLVVLVLRNEATNLERLLPPLLEVVRRENFDLLAIDDASTDGSPGILEAHGVPTITLIQHLGVGGALQTGYKYAAARDYEYLLQLDGDGQHDPRFLPLIHQQLTRREHDFVIGSRFLRGGATPFPPERMLYTGTVFRRIGIRWFRMLLYAVTGVSISDPTSGYRGMNRKCLVFLSGDLFPHDYPDADVLATLIGNRFRLCEVPVHMYRNDAGQLHRGLAPVWYAFKMTLSLLLSGIRKRER